MGIYPQPNAWQCGPFALKHALLVYAVVADEDDITALAGARARRGADERQLAHAAAHYGCGLDTARRFAAARARVELGAQLRRGRPVLLCVSQWAHWVTVVHEEGGRFVVCDSHDPAVVTVMPWERLQSWWAYHPSPGRRAGRRRPIYDLHPLVPLGRPRATARFTLARAHALRARRGLAGAWAHYVDDLLALAAPPDAAGPCVSLSRVLGRHRETILGQLDFWHGDLDHAAAAALLDDLQFVAETYGLQSRPDEEPRVLVGASMVLALWAAGIYGVNAEEVYPLPAPRRP